MHKSYLIKPASSLCNMNCKYCFYADVSSIREISNYGIMSEETVDCIIKQALEISDEITFAFQGGEPTMAGIDYFKKFVARVNFLKQNQKIHYSIQTNGLLINDEWIELFKSNHFLVGLSIDGYKNNHDSIRIQGYNGTFDRIMKTLKLLQNASIDYNVLTVLTNELAKHPKTLYEFYKKNHIKYVQIIPCLPEISQNNGKYSLTPKNYYLFFITLFKLWKKDLESGKYISISLFDQLVSIFSNKMPSMCGMLGKCQIQNIIEANGNVYPCDFYCVDEYLMGNVHEMKMNEMVCKHFFNSEKRVCQLCGRCKFRKICNGNCKRMNVTYFTKTYCGYQQFLEETYKDFYMITNFNRGML